MTLIPVLGTENISTNFFKIKGLFESLLNFLK